MTMMPSAGALRPVHPQGSGPAPAPLVHDFNEPCTVLVGWRSRDAVLRMITPTHAVIGGVTGLRPGDCLRLALHRGRMEMRECRVLRTTLQGVELEHFGTGMLAFATM